MFMFTSRTDDYELLASEIVDKTSADVAEYYPVFQEKWHTLTGSYMMRFFLRHFDFDTISFRIRSHFRAYHRG